MPRIKVIMKSGRIHEFSEKAPINTYSNLNTVRYEGPFCIVTHALGKKETYIPVADVERVVVER